MERLTGLDRSQISSVAKKGRDFYINLTAGLIIRLTPNFHLDVKPSVAWLSFSTSTSISLFFLISVPMTLSVYCLTFLSLVYEFKCGGTFIHNHVIPSVYIFFMCEPAVKIILVKFGRTYYPCYLVSQRNKRDVSSKLKLSPL